MMGVGFTCRTATEADYPAIAALLRSSDLPVEDIAPERQEFLVSGPAGSLEGCIGLERRGRFGLVRSLAVAEARRGSGLGGFLLGKIIARSSELNLDYLFLLTTTASVFFGKRGFTIIDRDAVPLEIASTEEFRSICPLSSTVMRLGREAPIGAGAIFGP
jgi:amino-acid N-acetyltransferase